MDEKKALDSFLPWDSAENQAVCRSEATASIVDEDDNANTEGFCTKVADCPTLQGLPEKEFLYFSLGIFVFTQVVSALFTYFSTKYEAMWLYRIHGIYAVAAYEVERICKEKARAAVNLWERQHYEKMSLPELVAKGRDDTYTVLGIFWACVIGFAYWLMVKNHVIAGLIVGVIGGMSIASTVHASIKATREIIYATWQVTYNVLGASIEAFDFGHDDGSSLMYQMEVLRQEISVPRDADDTAEPDINAIKELENEAETIGLMNQDTKTVMSGNWLDPMIGTVNLDESGEKPILVISKGKPKERMTKARESAKRLAYAASLEQFGALIGAIGQILLFLALGLTSSLIIDHIAKYGDPQRCACYNKNCKDIGCPDMDILPEVATIFTAAIIYSALVILHAMFIFLSTKFDKHYSDALNAQYGQLQFATKKSLIHAGHEELPTITSHEMDEVTVISAFVSCFAIGIGNWLCARADVTSGLILCVVGAKALSFFVTKTVLGAKEITYAKLQMAIRLGKHSLRYGESEVKKDVAGIVIALEKLKKYIKLSPRMNPSRKGLAGVFG